MYRLILLSVAAGVLGSIKQTGICDPYISYDSVVDLEVFAGTWYLLESLGKSWDGGDCPQSVLSKCDTDPKNILETLENFTINGIEYSIPREVLRTISNGTLVNVNAYTVEDTPLVTFYVLSRNLTSYSFAYNCVQNTVNTKTVTAYKFSKFKKFSEEDALLLDSISDKYDELRDCEWKTFDHTDCPF